MVAYDKRVYCNPSKEPFSDPEWEEAENRNEKEMYYWMELNGGKYIKLYKPAVAEVVRKRTGAKIYPVGEQRGEDE